MLVKPVDTLTLLAYLAHYPRLVVTFHRTVPTQVKPKPTTEYLFGRYQKGYISFYKKEGDKTGELPVDKMVFHSTYFARQVGTLQARYHYTGPMPWLTEPERVAVEWERIFQDVEERQ